jgi:FKBP-type peptidyl-prolyl cis-trans isomerase 2
MKKHDFVEIEYTGKLDDGTVFDTTDAATAKEAGLDSQTAVFGPAVICVGENHILPGLEVSFMDKKPGKFNVTLPPDKAFGKKDAKLLKLMPMRAFKGQDVQPFPGLEVNIDNNFGIVRSVSGGRVIVDFNHPLSSKTLHYDLTVNKIVTDTLLKAKSLFKNELQINDDILELNDSVLVIKEDKFPAEVVDAVKKRIMEIIPEIKDVVLQKEVKAAAKPVAKEPVVDAPASKAPAEKKE